MEAEMLISAKREFIKNLIEIYMKMSKLTAAYLAGFVDGEGYISLCPYINSTNNQKYYKTTFKVANTNKEIIEWLKSSYGGWIYIREYPNNPNNRTAFCWQASAVNIKFILQAIQPYLKIKKEQASLVLRKIKNQELLEKELPYYGISRINEKRLDKMVINSDFREKIKLENEEIYNRLKILNKRGTSLHAKRLSEITRKGSDSLNIAEKQGNEESPKSLSPTKVE